MLHKPKHDPQVILVTFLKKLAQLLLATILMVALETPTAFSNSNSWPQWGGPDRNFRSNSKGLASSWLPNGPPTIWSRDLGEGYSGIVGDGHRIYTMYRKAAEEIVVCM